MLLKKDGNITLRKFGIQDIEKKVEWINNHRNNKYLHYDLPLQVDKTVQWFAKVKDLKSRLDAVITCNDAAIGLIGLLNIDDKNKKAEFYICIGEESARGCGIAKKASVLLLDYAFNELRLNRIYLYTEQENVSAQKLFEKLGFKKEGLIEQDLIYNGRFVNRYMYGLLEEAYKNDCSNSNK